MNSNSLQITLFDGANTRNSYKKSDALTNVRRLYKMWKAGLLGGERMPEDDNPHLKKDSEENILYFTLPMALNYQRNSYKLWEGALKSYNDDETRFVFDPSAVLKKSISEVRESLSKYKIALQPNKHTEIWIKLCETIMRDLDGSIKNLFERCDYRVTNILEEIQIKKKKNYPYLSGNKIANYWLYVLTDYADLPLVDRINISVAPDTHVIQSTLKLGLINEATSPNVQQNVARLWKEILAETELAPIDIHTPMWLWSRGGFIDIIEI